MLPLLLLVPLLGCSEPDQIRRYKAPKPEVVAVNSTPSLPGGTAGRGQAGGARGLAESPPAGSGLDYTAPEEWEPASLMVSRGGITLKHEAAFTLQDGDQMAEVTVDLLPAASLLQNVNRWRGQIGLEPLSAEQLSEAATRLEIAGTPADYFELVGPEETILGIIAPRGGQALYFKLRGGSKLAEQEKERFREFARSVRFH